MVVKCPEKGMIIAQAGPVEVCCVTLRDELLLWRCPTTTQTYSRSTTLDALVLSVHSRIMLGFLAFHTLLAGLSAAQQGPTPQVTSRGVFKTAVPRLGSQPMVPPSPNPAQTPSYKANPGTFVGNGYTVGPTVTPTTTAPEAEEEIAVDPLNYANLVASISDFSLRGGFNTTKFAISNDNGATWTESFVPLSNGFPATADGALWAANSDPVVGIDRFGNIYVASLYLNASSSNSANGIYVSVGNLSGGAGSLSVATTYPVVTNLSPSTTLNDDKDWIAIDNSSNPATTGNVYVTWTHFTRTTNYILISSSNTHGTSWVVPLQISDPSQNGAVQGSQVAVGPSGEIYVSYLVSLTGNQGQIFLAKSTDGGNTFSTPAAASPIFNQLSFLATYRVDSFPAMAVSPVTGNVYVLYADQPNSTVSAEIEFVASTDGGNTFSAPVVINDVSTGQQFFPAIAVDGSDVIHASWFDTRNSSDNEHYDGYATFSENAGATFSPNARATTKLINATSASFIGDYSGIAASGYFAHPAWTNAVNLQTARLTLPTSDTTSTTNLSFGNQLVGVTSSPQSVIVNNTGNIPLFPTISITGANAGDFGETDNCTPSVAPGGSCTISVTFTPTKTGSRSATSNIVDNAPPSPQIVSLSGTGTAPKVSLSSNSLTFSTQVEGTTSATKTVTLTNSGTGPLNLSIAASGDFTDSNTCGTSVVAGTSCIISVSFTPTAPGTRTGAITITDNASTSPQTISLTGTGTIVALSPTKLTFASQIVGTSSPPKTITVTNVDSSLTLNVSSVVVGGVNAGDFTESDNCVGPIGPTGTCTISVTFTPTATGTRNAVLSVNDDGGGSPQNVTLTGSGIASNPKAVFSPASLTFSVQVEGTTSAGKNIKLSNTGNTTLTIASIVPSGDFNRTSTCGSTLAKGASCTITVTFTPTAPGTRSGAITVTDNASNSPQTVSLSGTGTIVSLSATELMFPGQKVGTTSAAKAITLTNVDTSINLNVSSINISGTNSSDFLETDNCVGTVPPLGTCAISVTFTPSATGTRKATLSVNDDDPASPQKVVLVGTGK